jgi:ABC-type multidrug transport system ATPase subunit
MADVVTSPKPMRAAIEDRDAPLAIETHGLTKRFGRQVAVDDIELVVPRGSVYGFLGPNGSGKTTTIRMLLGLVTPTRGKQALLGSPMPSSSAHVLPRIGALIEGPAFHPYLSGRANLVRLDAADRTVDPRSCDQRVDTALDRVGLSAAAGKRYRAYSLGMRQRLGLAAAMLRPRELLVLDEPTNGLDPQGTREVRALIRDLAGDGTTVFVSSHLLAEVEQMCSHVGVMRTGRLVAQGTLESLGATATARIRVDSAQAPQAAEILGRLGLPDVRVAGDEASGELGSVPPEHVTEALVLGGVPVRQLFVDRPHLEELFVSLTGEGFDVDE